MNAFLIYFVTEDRNHFTKYLSTTKPFLVSFVEKNEVPPVY